MTKAKQKELDRLAEFEVYETVDLCVALGKKRGATREEQDHRQDGIRARFVARRFKGDETMYDMLAPSSTLSTGRIIDNLSLKNSHHTFIVDVTNAYCHLDEDEECHVDPPAEWNGWPYLVNPTSVL